MRVITFTRNSSAKLNCNAISMKMKAMGAKLIKILTLLTELDSKLTDTSSHQQARLTIERANN
jgi:hypothetical protein